MQNEMRREEMEHQQRVPQHIQNEIRLAAQREEARHLSQQAAQFQREQEAQEEAFCIDQEEREHVEAVAYDQAHAAENATRIAHEAAEAAAQAQAEAAAQAQVQANAQAQAQAAQAAAQAGQLNQYLESLRQQELPPGRKAYKEPNGHHSLGGINVECQHCHALHWDAEKLTASTLNNKKFGQCCLQGQVDLPPFLPPPPTLKNLLCGISPASDTFRKHICQ